MDSSDIKVCENTLHSSLFTFLFPFVALSIIVSMNAGRFPRSFENNGILMIELPKMPQEEQKKLEKQIEVS